MSAHKEKNDSFMEDHIYNLNLLYRQLAGISAVSLSQYFAYTSTLESIELINFKYDEITEYVPNPDIPAINAQVTSIFLNLNILDISIKRYKRLYEKYINGQLSYSLNPNIYLIISNTLYFIGNCFSLLATLQIYKRNNNDPVIGI